MPIKEQSLCADGPERTQQGREPRGPAPDADGWDAELAAEPGFHTGAGRGANPRVQKT